MTVTSTHLPKTPRRSGGDEFRALLRDLQWVKDADPTELRAAVIAHCHRASRSTIDLLASDLDAARKVLIVARAVRAEFDAKLALDASCGDEASSLLRRRSAAESLVGACDAAVQLRQLSNVSPTASQLLEAIEDHRRRIGYADASGADLKLWSLLDRPDSPTV